MLSTSLLSLYRCWVMMFAFGNRPFGSVTSYPFLLTERTTQAGMMTCQLVNKPILVRGSSLQRANSKAIKPVQSLQKCFATHTLQMDATMFSSNPHLQVATIIMTIEI